MSYSVRLTFRALFHHFSLFPSFPCLPYAVFLCSFLVLCFVLLASLLIVLLFILFLFLSIFSLLFHSFLYFFLPSLASLSHFSLFFCCLVFCFPIFRLISHFLPIVFLIFHIFLIFPSFLYFRLLSLASLTPLFFWSCSVSYFPSSLSYSSFLPVNILGRCSLVIFFIFPFIFVSFLPLPHLHYHFLVFSLSCFICLLPCLVIHIFQLIFLVDAVYLIFSYLPSF